MTLPSTETIHEAFAARCGGAEAVTVDEGFGPTSVDVAPVAWLDALRCARDDIGLTYFDFLTAVDEAAPGGASGDADNGGVRVVAHVARMGEPAGEVAHLIIRTLLPAGELALASAVEVFRGAAWHERETYEMFGVDFVGHPHLVPLLLPDGFEGNPLRKSFMLAARAAKPWPGAKEPGESSSGAPARRRMVPPGVPDRETWGPRPALGADPSHGAGAPSDGSDG